ncbi:hypothetical protein A3H80_02945 [Candidatus Roizmanbacteria bacterium RIFCSPLOWO2_02_FULL_37_19]|uniref:Uncharacterized protein n=1 Tax=Candidatus Roizmanbacteria bacterium RIFCSPHIGHO2_02_FULL_37_24 TaxID=1802037 RepID=A0A1F7GYV9_9BACT|nr:MAG: hypothetical protein A2862_03760 [Candidatus Roizmanbacteria bacterium RIFCSPHIGHO2_01_FULL_38_41]OGK24280.1 MAG: hypothetical protein A3C24_04240 [Candidatus Roizmanbacteria bacterium RIFCSPHIGHO2_02_FULL_37_24]OGK43830.1 MAG: hypothetical protein A2956_04900 [Candidatus Roizmanbacteria bacterium RIFCSPLOWO2_01_FULL_37_57]OGK53817.1 MAG: hypothetical protein A3H80_02945 [Candidatus Roizmanbacteria bacterium RIFCSPLOWO2_02_FULL_37_19]HJZ23180.1 hypothetical protein [Candidatus Babeliale
MIRSNTIYSRLSALSLQQKESSKVSYWLEKLFYQEKERNSRLHNGRKDDNQLSHNSEWQNLNKNHVKKDGDDKLTIKDMVHNSNTILTSVSSVFPFDLFPKTINVEATRITIITRQLFSSQVHSIDIEDISSVFIETSILFAAISLISKTYDQKKFVVNNLWKNEAILIRRVIEGLRMFKKNGINITSFSKIELLGKLEALSATEIVL